MDKKNTLLLTVIAVATLLVAIVGATFAYFTAQVGAGADVPIKVETSTADTTMFSTPKEIVINANQLNFNETSGTATHSLMGTSFASVNYTANNNTKKGDYCYKVGLVVTENTFVYSLPKTEGVQKEGYYPELLLRIWKGTKEGTLVDVNSEEFNFDEKKTELEIKEYGTEEGINVTTLYPANDDDLTADSAKDGSAKTSIPYKTLDELTTKKICTVDAENYDTTEETNCEDVEGTIGGYDITMFGFTGTGEQATYKAAHDIPEAQRTPQQEADSKLYFDTTGLDVVSEGKKVLLIPADASDNYEHQLTIKTNGNQTLNDYWRFDVIFVNYSDKDIQVSGDGLNQAGLGDQYKNVGKKLRAKIRFQPLKECSNPKADTE